MKIRFHKPYYGALLEFAIIEGEKIVSDFKWSVLDECQITSPSGRIQIEEAQAMMDNLWECGLRPSEGSGSAGSLRATENHLNDMRKIAFKSLKIGEGK